MPRWNGDKTKQEKAFIVKYVETGDKFYAAKQAGYKYPDISAHQVLARPAVQDAIRERQVQRLNNDLLPLAVDALQRLLTDAKTPAGAQVQAAKLVFDRTLGSTEGEGRKELHEMTADDLAKELDKLKAEAAARAKPIIDVEVTETKPESGVFD